MTPNVTKYRIKASQRVKTADFILVQFLQDNVWKQVSWHIEDYQMSHKISNCMDPSSHLKYPSGTDESFNAIKRLIKASS